jgi:hypothetical protein
MTLSRRSLLRDMARLASCAATITLSWRPALLAMQAAPLAQAASGKFALTAADQALLDDIGQRAFLYFWEQSDPKTGLTKDRNLANTASDPRDIASIAANGFGLTALAIADKRGWKKSDELAERVRATLKFFLHSATQQHGFFFHFMHAPSGERAFDSEISTIDTALLLCGVLTCRAHFAANDREIQSLATQIYERVDWTWFLNGGATLSMGWKPDSGFLNARWNHYCELMMIYLLGLGSPTHPLPVESWDAWSRPTIDFQGTKYISSNDPLFVHQYSHAWFDFRGKHDRYANYFENSVIATHAHKLFCLSLAKQFPDYSDDLWGISASDSAKGYTAWGGPPPLGKIDGSLVPCAAGGSLVFLPNDTLRVLHAMREKYGPKVWARYGLVDAFNPLANWYNPDVLGIDLGIMMLMAENLRTNFVWDTFMKNAEAQRGLQRAGFVPGSAKSSIDIHDAPEKMSVVEVETAGRL